MTAGRPARNTIKAPFMHWLLAKFNCGENLTELSRRLNIGLGTLRSWAFERTSPETMLEIVASLENATGLTASELLDEIRAKRAG
jgi:hypothetical protein